MSKTRDNLLRGEPKFVNTTTPAQQAKAVGLTSLTQVSELTGQSLQTLSNWHKDKTELFKVVLLGCVSLNCGK